MTREKSSIRRLIPLFIFLGVVLIGAYFLKSEEVIAPPPLVPVQVDRAPFTIESQEIKEENFTGTVAQIKGESLIAQESRKYIDGVIAEFKIQADQDVPAMREDFGEDAPSANYSLEVSASRVATLETESAIINIATYTGGAHGSSSYKVITASLVNGKILSLSDIIKGDKEDAFVSYVKNKLQKWAPQGATPPVVFPEEVDDLEFTSFSNWALDEKGLNLYFSQYEIGPGVLGAVVVLLPFTEIESFLR